MIMGERVQHHLESKEAVKIGETLIGIVSTDLHTIKILRRSFFHQGRSFAHDLWGSIFWEVVSLELQLWIHCPLIFLDPLFSF